MIQDVQGRMHVYIGYMKTDWHWCHCGIWVALVTQV